MAGGFEELIGTRKLKLENSEEKISTHTAHEWGHQALSVFHAPRQQVLARRATRQRPRAGA